VSLYNDPNNLLSVIQPRTLYNVTQAVTNLSKVTTDTLLMAIPVTSGVLNVAGKTAQYTGSGGYTTAASDTPTLTFKLKLCQQSNCGTGAATTIATWTTSATTASVTNFPWRVVADITAQAIGSGGTVECHGTLTASMGSSITTAETRLDQNSAVSAPQDLTQALYVVLTVAKSTAGNTSITQRQGHVHFLN
jgi:hypothetical protein